MTVSALCGMLGVGLFAATLASAAEGGPAGPGDGPEAPPVFIENNGQWPAAVRYRARLGRSAGWFTPGGFLLDLHGEDEACAVRFTFGAEAAVAPEGEAPLVATYHFLTGASSSRARAFERLRYPGIAAGVDLLVRDGDGLFEYDLFLEPGAELSRLVIAVEGATALTLESDGALSIETPLGALRQEPPVAWTLGPEGTRHPVRCTFRILEGHRYGFAAPDAAPLQPLVIDPGLKWSSYLGDTGDDVVTDVVLAADGQVIAAGTTSSSAFPTTPGVYDPSLSGYADAFVTRFTHSGTAVVFSTFLGGSGNDVATALALGPTGEIWVTGETDSPDFPTTVGASDPTHNGAIDIFLARLDPTGSTLQVGTYLGAGADDRARAIAIAPNGSPVICGSSNSPAFPTTPGAFDRFFDGGTFGGGDAVVARFTPDASALDFSTWLGGGGNEQAADLGLGSDGSVTVGGYTSSSNFPITSGVFDSTHNGSASSSDGFVARLEGDGTALRWSTYLGGTDSDHVEGLAVEAGGGVVVVGSTSSTDYPVTPGALESAYQGWGDGFVTWLDAAGAALHHSTYLGGTDIDRALDVELDEGGMAAVTGSTYSPDFPITPWAFDTSFNSPPGNYEADAFVARFSPAGELAYGSYLGSLNHEEGTSIAVDWVHGAVVGGHTNSYNFPEVWGSFDDTYDGSMLPDGFVTTFDFARYPIFFGSSKLTSSNWTPYLGYSGFPSRTSGSFSLWVEGTIAHSWGYFLESTSAVNKPFMGGTLLVGHPVKRSALQTFDWFGAVNYDVPIYPGMVGVTYHYQVWFSDPGDPYGVGLSNGLEVTYVP